MMARAGLDGLPQDRAGIYLARTTQAFHHVVGRYDPSARYLDHTSLPRRGRRLTRGSGGNAPVWPGSWEWEREICLAELPQLSRESSAARHLAKRSAGALNDYRIRKCGGRLSPSVRFRVSLPPPPSLPLFLSARSARPSAQFITPNTGRSIHVLAA